MDTERTVREVVEDAKLKPGKASVLVRLLDSQVLFPLWVDDTPSVFHLHRGEGQWLSPSGGPGDVSPLPRRCCAPSAHVRLSQGELR